MFKKTIFLIMLFSVVMFCQKSKFETHTSTLSGELTEDDIYEKDFGRFDAYELQLEEGDFLIMKLNASFFPLLTVVSPSSEYQIAFPSDSSPEVIFQQDIDESGLWQIYIAGDSTDFGKHALKLCYVSENTRTLPPNSDYCTLVEFFLAHSKTNFFYFRNKDGKIKNGKSELKINLQNLFDSGEVAARDDVSKVTLHKEETGDNTFENISQNLKMCLKRRWNMRSYDNRIEFKEIEGLRRVILEKVKDKIDLTIFTR